MIGNLSTLNFAGSILVKWIERGSLSPIKAVGAAIMVSVLGACGGGGDASVVDESEAGAPTLTAVEASASAASSLLTIGDEVTVNITASEPIIAPRVTIAGGVADSVSGSGTSWTATRTLAAGDPVGDISFSVVYSDISGVAGVTVTRVTNDVVLSYSPFEINAGQSDEFSGTELSSEVWQFQNGDGSDFGIPAGWGNNELQIYTAEQAAVVDGVLVITAAEVGGPTSATTGGNY